MLGLGCEVFEFGYKLCTLSKKVLYKSTIYTVPTQYQGKHAINLMKRYERGKKVFIQFLYFHLEDHETNKMRMFQHCMELWNKNFRPLGSVLFVVKTELS